MADFFNIECNLAVPSITVPTSNGDTDEYAVSWQASPVSGVTYQLEEATDSSFTIGLRTVTSGITALSAPVSGRTIGVTYYYRVRAEKAGISSVWTDGANGCTVKIRNNTGECRYDGSNYAVDEEGQLYGYWGGTSYWWGDVAQTDTYGRMSFETGGHSYTFGALKHNSTWNNGASWYREYVICRSDTGEELSSINHPGVLSIPTNNITGSYTVTWGASTTSDVTYRLDEATSADFSTGLRTVTSSTTSLSAAISGRTLGVTYYYRVRAESAVLGSAWIVGANGCLITLPIAPPSISVPAGSATGSYSVSWGASPSVGVTYRLEEATNSSFSSGLRTVVSGTTALLSSISGRTIGVTYYYRVRAEQIGFTSAWRTSTGCVVTLPPAAPPWVSVPAGGSSGSYSVSWGGSPTVGVTYRLEEATNSSFTVGLRMVVTGTTALSSTISGRTGGTTYYYRVRAEKVGLSSAWATGANGCAVPLLPAAPSSISVPAGDSAGSYSVSWGGSPTVGVTYRLEEATNSSFSSGLRTVVSGTTALSSSLSGRTIGVTYYYRVRAEKVGLSSAWATGANGCAVTTFTAACRYDGLNYAFEDSEGGGWDSAIIWDGIFYPFDGVDAAGHGYFETGGYRYTFGALKQTGASWYHEYEACISIAGGSF